MYTWLLLPTEKWFKQLGVLSKFSISLARRNVYENEFSLLSPSSAHQVVAKWLVQCDKYGSVI